MTEDDCPYGCGSGCVDHDQHPGFHDGLFIYFCRCRSCGSRWVLEEEDDRPVAIEQRLARRAEIHGEQSRWEG